MNREKHISSAFDRDLETIQALAVKMGGMVEAAISDAATALETSDVELAEQVRRRDKAIDALEVQLNEDAARLIALRAPTATDLRMVLAVMKIAHSLEPKWVKRAFAVFLTATAIKMLMSAFGV